MGSVKDLITDDSPAGRLYRPATPNEFGQGVWQVSGRFSVGDLKDLIPETNITDKAEALTMSTGAFFEFLAANHPNVPTCYLGVLDKDCKITDVTTLIQRGDRTNLIAMKLAHVPLTYCNGDLDEYRRAISSGKLQCGVADVESIFRRGFPLGSSLFEKIFKATGRGEQYKTLATYQEVVSALGEIRAGITLRGIPIGLEKLLTDNQLGGTVPNPGFVLKSIVYNSTSKFEIAGDRDLSKEEEKRFSGLDEEGYVLWAEQMFPELARAQIEFCGSRRVLNIDGKGECVTYKRKPILTDFACSVDENRLMIETEDGWAIPSNKEIQRAIFRQAGVYAAISEAKGQATSAGNIDKWREYMPHALTGRGINLQDVTNHSCDLMGYAIGEVANRILGQRVFDAKPIESWRAEFMPFASKVEYQTN